MTVPIQLSFDANDPPRLAEFWAVALGYVHEPPPDGYDSWEQFGHALGIPEEQFGDYAALIDPNGNGPRAFFQRVEEGKTAKNRLHLDVNVRGGQSEDFAKVREHVQRLVEAGGTVLYEHEDPTGHHITMRDPEGNELCVQ